VLYLLCMPIIDLPPKIVETPPAETRPYKGERPKNPIDIHRRLKSARAQLDLSAIIPEQQALPNGYRIEGGKRIENRDGFFVQVEGVGKVFFNTSTNKFDFEGTLPAIVGGAVIINNTLTNQEPNLPTVLDQVKKDTNATEIRIVPTHP
jgi:hypothetical protein